MQLYDGLAVVDDLQFVQVGRTYPHQAYDLKGLLEASEALALDRVWIVPGSKLSTACSDVAANLDGWSTAASYCDPKARDRYNYVSARRVEKRHEDRIQVGLSEWHYWPWKVDRPRTLLGTVTYLQNGLGVPVEWSPAHVGLDFLRLKNQQTWQWFTPLKINIEEQWPGFKYGNTCKEIHWRLRGELPPGKYIFKVDGNSKHPAACTGVNLGEGDPEFFSGAMIAAFYDGKKPGFWEVEINPQQSIFDGLRAPAYSGQYLSTDLIEELRKRGYAIKIKSGWAWKTYHQTLRRPMTELYAMRLAARKDRELSTAHENVYKSYNAILHAIPGRLGDADGRDPHFRRRDWWAQIVSKSIATGFYYDWAIYQKTGLLPVCEDVDARLYVTDEPDPAKALPGFIDREKLGAYKDEYVMRITPEIREWFRDPSISDKGVMRRLNELHQAKVKQLHLC